MKKLFLVLGWLAFIWVFAFSAMAGDLKIGYVDTIEVFNQYQRTLDQEEYLEGEKEEVQKTLGEKEEQIREAQKKLEVIRESQREAEERKLQEAMREYRDLRQQELAGVTRKRDEMMKEIVEDIDQAIKKYAEANNYDLIINGNSILYAPEDKDLTSTILDIINREYKR